MIKPYWQSADGAIRVFHARCEDVIASVLPVREVALIHGDPVYGIGEQAHRPGRQSGVVRKGKNSHAYGKAREYPALEGNDKPYDPALILALDRPTVLWGANHYSSRLPDSPAWIVWDKRDGTAPDDGSDAELAWTNLGGALRTFRHAWRGLARASETGVPHLGPTQKPVALSVYVGLERAKLKKGDLMFVPYLGTGPDLAAAFKMGWRVVACDVSRHWCDVAIGRLGAITADRAAEPCGPLFAAVEPVRK